MGFDLNHTAFDGRHDDVKPALLWWGIRVLFGLFSPSNEKVANGGKEAGRGTGSAQLPHTARPYQ